MSLHQSIRVWHDDIRTPPDETWTWARTNDEAIALLKTGDVIEISLDHDLGLHELDPAEYESPHLLRGTGEATGLDLVDWMCFHDIVPSTITIHSWNPPGAQRMFRTFCAKGYNHARVKPFEVSR